MDDAARLGAIESIRNAKAQYFRGVDTRNTALVQAVLADDCVLDFRGSFTDPQSANDFLPAMNVVVRGAATWSSEGFASMGIVSVHHGHHCEITITSDTSASGIWSMTDRLFFTDTHTALTGYGYYYETYTKEADGAWKIKTLRLERLRVEER